MKLSQLQTILEQAGVDLPRKAQEQILGELKKFANFSCAEIVGAELARVRAKFPQWPTDPIHALAVVTEEHGELARAILQATYELPLEDTNEVTRAIRDEAIQLAAMAMRFVENLPMYRLIESEQHSDSGRKSQSDSKGGAL